MGLEISKSGATASTLDQVSNSSHKAEHCNLGGQIPKQTVGKSAGLYPTSHGQTDGQVYCTKKPSILLGCVLWGCILLALGKVSQTLLLRATFEVL